MTAPSIKKPSKKTFHFPKGAAAANPADESEAVGADATVATKKGNTTAKKAAKRRASATVEATPVKAAVEAKAKRIKKEKVVRDSFTMPKSDYDKIAALKQKCLAAGVSVKRSEILRAGLFLLESATPKRLLEAVSAVEQVKTGRPAKS
ncbi:hypothetical protein BCh11DRAFT_02987 [Burkholderia sp. Ch1-1]|uniref:Uncharacterized protein n=1 Tax=Paraburkholderia dioscoreae TaxID=2604047 RepID=A0A5Q4ZNK8_9BURK|nr:MULTISPECIES: hypothetical protein [Paraburkholderia]EIF35174.1 hypothetical protein BCh11DRAFT_02987 [Burkholderia sp. Ch1-1]MDR8401147.1 hypothetical protein [Paraburkholderia sp. USG1]VVD34383.1 conserved protein of unknown function [Paraburkholderia dioscoreae]